LRLYDLIESIVRFETANNRTSNEGKRNKLFIEAFYNDTLRPEQKEAARKVYLIQVNENIQ
jgi:hypothetical protein